MKAKKIAVFPGSFDPFTNAHFDLVRRGLEIFDQIIIAIGVNSSKKNMFSPDQRLNMIKDTFSPYSEDQVRIVFFEGLTVDFCADAGAGFILRGMRNVMDFESERAIAQHNKELSPAIETVFLVSPGNYSHISSTIIREILVNGGNASHFVPGAAWKSMQNILAEKERGN